MIILKNKIFLFFILGFFIFFAKNSLASPVYDFDTTDGAGSDLNLASGDLQQFRPSDNKISGVRLANTHSFGSSINITLCKGIFNGSNFSSFQNCGSGNQFIASSTCSRTPGVNVYTDCYLNYTYNIIIGADYYFQFSGDTSRAWGSNSTAHYFAYNCYFEGNCSTNGANGYYVKFKTFFDSDTPTNYQIDLLTPINNLNLASTTIYFVGNTVQPVLTYNRVYISIFGEDDTNMYERTSGSAVIDDLNDNFTIIKILPQGNYKWYAWFYDGNNQIASSSLEHFRVLDNGLPQFNDANICVGVATSTIMGGIECAFKKLSYFLLSPSDESKLALTMGYENIKASFPFNAFFGLTDAFSSAISTTTLSTNNTFDIPFINTNGQYYMLPVMSSSSLSNLIGGTNANLFRNSITWIFWLLAGSIVFITFKKI